MLERGDQVPWGSPAPSPLGAPIGKEGEMGVRCSFCDLGPRGLLPEQRVPSAVSGNWLFVTLALRVGFLLVLGAKACMCARLGDKEAHLVF